MKFMVQNRARVYWIISAAILVIALLMTVIGFGLNRDIDFTGGVALRYDMGEVFNPEVVRAALAKQGMGNAQIVAGSAPLEAHDHDADPNHEHDSAAEAAKTRLEVRVKALSDPEAAPAALEAALRASYPQAQFVVAETVGAAANDLMSSARLCVLVACALMLIYVTIRFDLMAGVAAALGMLHDVLLMAALVVVLRISVHSAFFAVPPAIAAYSIVNTLVLFARIRETNGKSGARNLSREELVTYAAREALPRTLGIAVATVLVTKALWIFGAPSVKAVALPLCIGALVCICSSNLLTGYVWAWLLKLKGNK